MKQFLIPFVLGLLVMSFVAYGQVPKRISYQGLLTTSSDSAVTDGSYNLQFDIFNELSGGTALWTETQSAVSVQHGRFHVILGSTFQTGITLPFDHTYYVEVTVASGPGISSPLTFSPRSQLTSAPYALRADTAQTFTLPFFGTSSASGTDAFMIWNNTTNSSAGVFANLQRWNENPALYVVGTEGDGVQGISTDMSGVHGINDQSYGYGVLGESHNGIGVRGTSTNGTGIYGTSDSAIGVYGYLSSSASLGAAVRADGNDNSTTPNTALLIRGGAIKVSGTVKPAFVHTTASTGSSDIIDHPLLNNNPNAMIFVTPVEDMVGPARDVSVEYSSPNWYLISYIGFVSGMKYNILVISQ